MFGALISLLRAPLDWMFYEREQWHIDDYSAALERQYEERFGEPWSALEEKVLARHPEFLRFMNREQQQ